MATHLNIPPGPCPSCGKPLRMSQAVCFGCGHDRVSGVNVNSKPERPTLWKLLIASPIGFLLSTNAVAIGIAFAVDGSPGGVRVYLVATAIALLISAFLVARDYIADPPGFWQMWSGTAHDWYMMDKLFGDGGPKGMQCLVMFSIVMAISGFVLNAGLPPDARLF